MVTVWSVRNSASPQELQSQELGGKKAGLEKGRESLYRLSGSALRLACAFQSTTPLCLACSENARFIPIVTGVSRLLEGLKH